MDMRTGQIYDTEEAARLAGAIDPQPVTLADGTVTIENGPFKGRVYAVESGKRGRRLKHLEKTRQK